MVHLFADSWSYIMKHGTEDLVEKFLSEPDGEKAETDEHTALQSQLYIAAFWGLLDTVKNLLAAGIIISDIGIVDLHFRSLSV